MFFNINSKPQYNSWNCQNKLYKKKVKSWNRKIEAPLLILLLLFYSLYVPQLIISLPLPRMHCLHPAPASSPCARVCALNSWSELIVMLTHTHPPTRTLTHAEAQNKKKVKVIHDYLRRRRAPSPSARFGRASVSWHLSPRSPDDMSTRLPISHLCLCQVAEQQTGANLMMRVIFWTLRADQSPDPSYSKTGLQTPAPYRGPLQHFILYRQQVETRKEDGDLVAIMYCKLKGECDIW